MPGITMSDTTMLKHWLASKHNASSAELTWTILHLRCSRYSAATVATSKLSSTSRTEGDEMISRSGGALLASAATVSAQIGSQILNVVPTSCSLVSSIFPFDC